MLTFDQFHRELHKALTHLYDVDYSPPQALCLLVGCEPGEGAHGLRSVVTQMIESLKPQCDAPGTARLSLLYRLLHDRFVLGLTQENTARRLHISLATAWRLQRKAIYLLAQAFWKRAHQCADSSSRFLPGGDAQVPELGEEFGSQGQISDWREQVKRELALLQANAPVATCELVEVIDHLMELKEAFLGDCGTDLRIGFVQPKLIVAMPSSVVSQLLITMLRRLAIYAKADWITIFAGLEDGTIKITLAASLRIDRQGSPEEELVRNIVATDNIAVAAELIRNDVFVSVTLPSVGVIDVLVVDDNPDMGDFYRRATEGTHYRIAHIREGRKLAEAMWSIRPVMIVLDVLLPDINGWELLMHLRMDPATRDIPVIVCTVAREEELALSLGAVAYLPKPVRPSEFIQTLDRVHSQFSARPSRSQASTAKLC